MNITLVSVIVGAIVGGAIALIIKVKKRNE